MDFFLGHMHACMGNPRTATAPIPNYRTLSRQMPPYAGPPCLGLASTRRVSFGIPRRDTTPHTHSHISSEAAKGKSQSSSDRQSVTTHPSHSHFF